ncbi:MAG: hypothetical protein GY917_27100, partial [Planctomycetaceae bacterium]|nr:hypothetical protein [Planctomycetaceae bacterium]
MTVLRCRRQITFAGIVLISGLVGCRQETTPQQPPQLTTDISQQQLDDVLDFTFRERHLNLQQHAAWQILHGVLV